MPCAIGVCLAGRDLPELKPGVRIECRRKGSGNAYEQATIRIVHRDGSVDVRFVSDSVVQTRVPAKQLRAVQPGSPKSKPSDKNRKDGTPEEAKGKEPQDSSASESEAAAAVRKYKVGEV